MRKKFTVFISYIAIFFNPYLIADENKNHLKVGLLAPLSGEYAELGNSLLYSLQLALDEINDKNVFIVPRDSGFNDKEKLNSATKELREQGIKVVIGPLSNEEFSEVKKYNDLVHQLWIKEWF